MLLLKYKCNVGRGFQVTFGGLGLVPGAGNDLEDEIRAVGRAIYAQWHALSRRVCWRSQSASNGVTSLNSVIRLFA